MISRIDISGIDNLPLQDPVVAKARDYSRTFQPIWVQMLGSYFHLLPGPLFPGNLTSTERWKKIKEKSIDLCNFRHLEIIFTSLPCN